MNKNLLIIGAGVYGLVAKEIAESMGTFEKIDFIDDHAKTTPNGLPVLASTTQLECLIDSYYNVIVAIGNSEIRLQWIKWLEALPCRVVNLISPKAHVSPSAQIGKGCVIEPMAVIHTGCVLQDGCLVSAGSVVNHCSTLSNGVHVDCNATVMGNTVVPPCTKVYSGKVFP